MVEPCGALPRKCLFISHVLCELSLFSCGFGHEHAWFPSDCALSETASPTFLHYCLQTHPRTLEGCRLKLGPFTILYLFRTHCSPFAPVAKSVASRAILGRSIAWQIHLRRACLKTSWRSSRHPGTLQPSRSSYERVHATQFSPCGSSYHCHAFSCFAIEARTFR
jgi:hypothetical protein